jgi:Lrp/AsnC family transcriptional regulator, regulator of ectoine-degradation genes
MQRLDARDLAILRVLAEDGRISKTALAEKVGLSPTPTWERLQRLEKTGIIEGYGARISLRQFGPSVTVFVTAELSDHTAASFRRFEEAVARHEEITACWALGGGHDYLLQVVTRDIDAYQRLIDALLESHIGMVRYYSYIVTKAIKSGPPPLGLFAG